MATPAMMPQTATQMDPYDQSILNALKTGYPGRDQSFYDEQLNYYRGKRGSGETSAWATGQPGRTMDDYWAARAGGMGAGGADAATAGQWAGGDAPAPGGGMTMGGGFSSQPVNGVASFNAPGLLAPYTKEFNPTNIQTILDAPAFQAAQANGMDELGRSAAASGTLLTGGFGKDLMKYSMGLSLGELNNQFNRDNSTFNTNRDTFYGNQNNAYNKLNGYTNTGAGIAQNVGGYGTAYANNSQVNANNQGTLLTNQGDSTAAAGMANAQNSNNTFGNIANGVWNAGQTPSGGWDWRSIFKPKTSTTGTPDPVQGSSSPRLLQPYA